MNKSDQCAQLLRGLLANGPVDSAEIHQQCQDEGYGRKAIEAARDKIRVVVEKAPEFQGRWQWQLPDDSKGAPEGTSLDASDDQSTSLEQEQF